MICHKTQTNNQPANQILSRLHLRITERGLMGILLINDVDLRWKTPSLLESYLWLKYIALKIICMIKYHHHHHVVLVARISLTFSRHFSLSFIASGRSSGQHPVSSHSCWMYVRAGRPAFARPCVGVHKSTSLMSSSPASPALSCMFGSSNLNSFRDRRQVAVQLVSCWVLPPGLVQDCSQQDIIWFGYFYDLQNFGWFRLVFSHTNHCGLFNTKFIFIPLIMLRRHHGSFWPSLANRLYCPSLLYRVHQLQLVSVTFSFQTRYRFLYLFSFSEGWGSSWYNG